MFYCSAKLAC
uniref:Uncharacterized protein n=1 Tax=Anguilla anguilla TaxID=7936 RepID=A0A0E9QJW6_ANGAN